MPAAINDLPYELLSQILDNVIRFNVEQNSLEWYGFDMGLHAPPDPDARMLRLLKGLMTPDSVRWYVFSESMLPLLSLNISLEIKKQD